jgi:hypothetical protein
MVPETSISLDSKRFRRNFALSSKFTRGPCMVFNALRKSEKKRPVRDFRALHVNLDQFGASGS